MTEKFLRDTALQNWQTRNSSVLGALDKTPAIKGDSLTAVFKELKASIDKIKARGGKVMFVRTPSSGGLSKQKMWYIRGESIGMRC
jgi:predicted enzyme related to lactoylglutathione lyase